MHQLDAFLRRTVRVSLSIRVVLREPCASGDEECYDIGRACSGERLKQKEKLNATTLEPRKIDKWVKLEDLCSERTLVRSNGVCCNGEETEPMHFRGVQDHSSKPQDSMQDSLM